MMFVADLCPFRLQKAKGSQKYRRLAAGECEHGQHQFESTARDSTEASMFHK